MRVPLGGHCGVQGGTAPPSPLTVLLLARSSSSSSSASFKPERIHEPESGSLQPSACTSHQYPSQPFSLQQSPRTNPTKNENHPPRSHPPGGLPGTQKTVPLDVPGSTRETPGNPPGSPDAVAQGPNRPDAKKLQNLQGNHTLGRYLAARNLTGSCQEADRKLTGNWCRAEAQVPRRRLPPYH